MGRPKREWLDGRRNWTREQQKERIMLWFKVRSEKGDFSSATAQKIANGLQMISAANIKDICDEMVVAAVLQYVQVIHRVRKDGTEILKSLYVPYCMEEWHDAFVEQEYAKRGYQKGLWDK